MTTCGNEPAYERPGELDCTWNHERPVSARPGRSVFTQQLGSGGRPGRKAPGESGLVMPRRGCVRDLAQAASATVSASRLRRPQLVGACLGLRHLLVVADRRSHG